MKNLLQFLLRAFSRLIIKKYKPDVIGITGSVGKTSAKQAIAAVLTGRFRVRENEKNYNNEIGVPLTIIGAHSGGKNPLKWAFVFLKASCLLLWKFPSYPHILILEMGADRPGDIAYLTTLAPCKVGVVTAVGEAHHEFFKQSEAIVKEKSIMVTHLSQNGIAVLNADNEHTVSMIDKAMGRVITFGFAQDAQLKAHEEQIAYTIDQGMKRPAGIRFKISEAGSTVPIFVPGVLGRSHIMAALSGAAVGRAYEMNLVEISEKLRQYEPACGRMRLLPGIKQTTIIDDTYNASPMATILALDALRSVELHESGERYAVLGDMLELGKLTDSMHRDIGQRLQAFNVDFLIIVGERARLIAKGAIEHGFPEHRIAKFDSSEEAGKFLQDKLESGDIVLLKASQGIRMEKAVLEVMADPLSAKRQLCRQDTSWK